MQVGLVPSGDLQFILDHVLCCHREEMDDLVKSMGGLVLPAIAATKVVANSTYKRMKTMIFSVPLLICC
jgi:hypothetical protein